MVDQDVVSSAEWLEARAQSNRVVKITFIWSGVLIPSLAIAVLGIGRTLNVSPRPLLTALVVLVTIHVFIMYRVAAASRLKSERLVSSLIDQLSESVDVAARQAAEQDRQVHRQEFESRLANALDMAEGEPEVIDVIERSFEVILPTTPGELLLADNSHAHLGRMAISPTAGAPGCPVDSPDHCPAARRAQVQVFSNSEHLDACPKLRGRGPNPLSAACVPVSIMGRTVGVIHATAAEGIDPSDEKLHDLAILAKLAGARLGLLRVMAETQLQASTDSLTGLLNRRSFEEQVSATRREVDVISVAIGDLDHFKKLNDTYGHNTGDRALRLFSQVLVGAVRANDLVSRHGGEEFVVALPGCDGSTAANVLNALRRRLETAITVAGVPMFTVSFGVVESRGQESLSSMIGRADVALFEAKRGGRDQVVVHDDLGSPVLQSVTLTDVA